MRSSTYSACRRLFGSEARRRRRTGRTGRRADAASPRDRTRNAGTDWPGSATRRRLAACPCRAPEAARPRFASALQPTLDVEQDPGFLTVLAQSRHQEAVIEIVEQTPDVELHHPVLVPATASGDGDRLQRRFPRPIAIGIVVEERIKLWLQPHLDRRLRDPVGYRRDAQHPHAPGLLRNRHAFTGGGK